MTRSSNKELFTPFKDAEREFQSSRKHFKTLSLDESRSPDFDQFSDQEEYSEEESLPYVLNWSRKSLAKKQTIWFDYNLGRSENKFLSKYYPPARTTKQMEEINNFQQEQDENLYQARERFKELLMKCPQHYLSEMHEVVLFCNGLDVTTRQILDLRGAIPSKTATDAKVAIQEMAEYS
ncbi:reverse transcriptase domain-containing protein [Tanacetum coccineum]